MHTDTNFFVLGRRRGVTLIEAAITLGIIAILMVGLSQLLTGAAETSRARSVADRLQQVASASQAYIKANFSDLMAITNNATPVSIPVEGAGTVAVPNGRPALKSLEASGFLPDSFVDVNAFNQNHVLLLKKTGVAPNIRLDGIVTTRGGNTIPDRMLSQVSSIVGAEGGVMLASPVAGAVGDIAGTSGGWSASAAQWSSIPTVGRAMALVSSNEKVIVGDYLNRNDISIPEANTMRTNIDMGTNNLNNVDEIGGVLGYITARDTVRAPRFEDSDNANYYVDPAGLSTIRALDAEYINVNSKIYDAADGVSPDGSQVTLLKDRLPNYVMINAFTLTSYTKRSLPVEAPPSCGANGLKKLMMTPVNDSYSVKTNVTIGRSGDNIVNTNNMTEWARGYAVEPDNIDNPTQWVIINTGADIVPKLDYGWSILAMTFCYYPPGVK